MPSCRSRPSPALRGVIRRCLAVALSLLLLGAAGLPSQASAVVGPQQTAEADDALPTSPFDASQLCDPGTYFSLASDGTIGRSTVRNKVPDGGFTRVGSFPINPDYANGVPALGDQQGPANGLALSPNGVFYGLQPRAHQTRDARTVWYADLFRFDASSGAARKVFSGFEIDRGAQDSAGWKQYRTIAGAVDPHRQEFVFGNVRDSGSGTWVLDLFRYKDGAPPYLGASIRIPGVGTSVNGDIAFDSLGNLFFIQGDARSGTTRIVTVTADRLQAAQGKRIDPDMVSSAIPSAGAGLHNGIAFDSDSTLIIQWNPSGSRNSYNLSLDSNTLQPISPARQTNMVEGTDLASCQTPSTLTLKKVVLGREQPDDQFTLAIKAAEQPELVLGSATTSGRSDGLQRESAGPVPAMAGKSYLLSEGGVRAGSLADYDSSYQCLKEDDGKVLASGLGTGFTLRGFPASSTSLGINVVCTFTNSPKPQPELVVSKTVDPASGTVLNPGQRAGYTLTFDNRKGTAAVDVEYTDLLDDVLDDADLVEGSIVVEPTLTAVLKGSHLIIGGEVPSGKSLTVRYAVTVKPSGSGGDGVLRNLLVKGPPETIRPPDCDDPDTNCTDNPVSDARWTLHKESDPASGSSVSPGTVIRYSVTARATEGTVPDAVLDDDLSDVLHAATFVPGSAQLATGSSAPRQLPDPEDGKLRTPAFELSPERDVVLSYRVKVNDGVWGATLRNLVSGTGSTPPENCVPGASRPECSTEHHTPLRMLIQKLGDGPEGAAPLDGAAFEIRADAAGAPGAAVDPGPVAVSGEVGLFEATGLAAGTYWLVETKAPEGHTLLAEPVRFTLSAKGVSLDGPGSSARVSAEGITISVTDLKSWELPAAGGEGSALLQAAGLALLGLSILSLLLWRHSVSRRHG
ncbi:prealbumin-like fold domain-containing protein [Arthrobacter sp. NPDC090010]|uniref:prealbumin-like fold domain-containing protein n=1 Tax=Arthrobacter sp. NPDC090010 TaxID=3363942 RepID=UPI0037F96731